MLSFFFNDTATTEIYTLSLHDALPISSLGHPRSLRSWVQKARSKSSSRWRSKTRRIRKPERRSSCANIGRSEEHTSELQSRLHLVCRLLLEKKKLPWAAPPARQRARTP